EFLKMTGFDTLTLRKTRRAAELLHANSNKLKKFWPEKLTATTVDGIEKYLFDNGRLATLDDYVDATRRHVAGYLKEMRDNGELVRLGITPKGKWKDWVASHTKRVVGMGIDSFGMADM